MNSLFKAYAEGVDTVAAPSFPFTPPDGGPTPTPTDEPRIVLNADKTTLKVGETVKVTIKIESQDESLKNYKVVISYDPTILKVIDKSTTETGVQISYIDTFFTQSTNVASESLGTIELSAASPSSAVTVNRNVGEIEFQALKADDTTVEVLEEQSLLTNASDANVLKSTVPIVITVTGSTGEPAPTPGLPKSGFIDNYPVVSWVIGIVLVLTGISIGIKYGKKDKKH